MNAWTGAAAVALLSVTLASACSSADSGGPSSTAGSAGTPSAQGGTPGTVAGGNGGGVSGAGTGGATPGGVSSGGAPSGGAAGTASMSGNGGMPVAGAGGSGTGGFEPGDTPPWRPLNVTAGLGEHLHGSAGLDTRAKPLGKLAVDIGVNSGGYVRWLAKRGYHVMGAPCGSCPAPNLGAGRDAVGTCRLGEFDNTAEHVKSTLTSLHGQFPEEDWGYFLNEDGSVRWSDVALTGMSHGATTAAVAGRVAQRLWRVVSRSGPRDTGCGNPGGVARCR